MIRGYLYILFIILSTALQAQDEIILRKTGKPIDVELTIMEVRNDTIYYQAFKKNKKISLGNVNEYYVTIQSEENLAKKKRDRQRIYYKVERENAVDVNKEPLDSDLIYIKKNIENLDWINSLDFADGFLVTVRRDTVFCKIGRSSGKENNTFSHLCVVSKIDDEIKYFYPYELKSYKRGEEVFVSYYGVNEKWFFIKLIETGKLFLYERDKIPSSSEFLYFFKFSDSVTYYFFNPFESGISSNDGVIAAGAKSIGVVGDKLMSKNITGRFKEAIIPLLSDCVKVKNQVLTDFYNINDFKLIVRAYNNCDK